MGARQNLTVALVAITAMGFGGNKAVAESDPRVCSAITDSLQRLNCYDRIFPVGQAEATTDEAEAVSTDRAVEEVTWIIQEDKSPLDDSPSVAAYLFPTTATSTGVGDGEATLMLRCRENTTSLIIYLT